MLTLYWKMYPGLTETSKWFALRAIVRPSCPRAGLLGAMNLWSWGAGGGEELKVEGGDWEHSLESGGVERSEGISVVGGRSRETGAELWSSDIVMANKGSPD